MIRCFESHLNVEDKGTMKVLYNIVDTRPGVDLWGSLPCDPWSQWQTLNIHQYGQAFADELEARRQKSRLLISLSRFFASWLALLRDREGV